MAVVLIIEGVNIVGPTQTVQVITDIYMTCLQLPGCTSYSSQPAAANLCCCTPVCSLVPSPLQTSYLEGYVHEKLGW